MANMSGPIADVLFVLVLPGLTLAEGRWLPSEHSSALAGWHPWQLTDIGRTFCGTSFSP